MIDKHERSFGLGLAEQGRATSRDSQRKLATRNRCSGKKVTASWMHGFVCDECFFTCHIDHVSDNIVLCTAGLTIPLFFQVVFLLTGSCENRTEEGYFVYHKLAKTTLGQVFHTQKLNIEKVSHKYEKL